MRTFPLAVRRSAVIRFDDIAQVTPASFRRPVVTIGMFDGLHRGHQHVLTCLRQLASKQDGHAVVVSFESHPMAVITGAPPRPILSREYRLRLLEAHGVDAVLLLPFDQRMRAMSYEAFTKEVLIDRIGVRALLFGYNSNFGHGGQGTPTSLTSLASTLGFDVHEAPAVDVGERPISSTRIRDAIRVGALEEAASMLGRPVAVLGTVVKGDGRGNALGFPTANVEVDSVLMPPVGVYRVDCEANGTTYRAVANLGSRPTFDEATSFAQPVLEVHIPNERIDLYGESVVVRFLAKIRDERRFESVDALKKQIRVDIESLQTTL